jgi:formylglycine-generating enzyme required for sulfatase activity
LRRALLFLALAMAPGCALLVGYKELVFDAVEGGAAGDGAADSGTDGAPVTDALVDGSDGALVCPVGDAGPTMVPVNGAFCIDSTEVTFGQYTAFFVATSGIGGSDVPGACEVDGGYALTPAPTPNLDPNLPIHTTTWCDAMLFCRWAQKRLCGSTNGGPVDYGTAPLSPLSQWYLACSSSGTLAYPYGQTFDATKCNGGLSDGGPIGADGGGFVDVGSDPNCVGGVPGLLDMSGNVSEWEDSCNGNTSPMDDCRVRGGSFAEVVSLLACNGDDSRARLGGETDPGVTRPTTSEVGFRCCWP